MVGLSPAYSPAVLKGIKLDPQNPFRFHFFIDKGDTPTRGQVPPTRGHVAEAPIGDRNVSRAPASVRQEDPSRLPSETGLNVQATQRNNEDDDQKLRTEATKLIKYFLASLTIPEKDLWVNLSPYEKDRIVPQEFGQTEMGRDLLAEDYLLKQITASLIYPESQLGKEFWSKVYAQAQAKYGTTNIPINTFNKVWIVPEKAVVYENGGTAFVLENHLKVMLEQDYLSMSKHQMPTWGHASEASAKAEDRSVSRAPASVRQEDPSSLPSNEALNAKAPQVNNGTTSENVNALGSQIVREIVIPALTKEVNEGKNFVQLRQVFYSLILATWYKKKIKDSILNKIYSDQKKIMGLSPTRGHVQDRTTKNVSPSRLPSNEALNAKAPQGNNQSDVEFIYQQYLKAFKKGVYNYIKEEADPATNEVVPRKYFSGGVTAYDMSQVIDAVGLERVTREQRADLAQMSSRIVNVFGDTVMIGQTPGRLANREGQESSPEIKKPQTLPAKTMIFKPGHKTVYSSRPKAQRTTGYGEHLGIEPPADGAMINKVNRPQKDNSPDMELGQAWVDAHPSPNMRAFARFILRNITYISQSAFEVALRNSVQSFRANLNERPYVYIDVSHATNAGKSNAWVYALARELGMSAPAHTYALNNMGNVNGTQDVLFIDDAGYSGAQTAQLIREMINRLPDKSCRIHVVVPFMTAYAERRIQDISPRIIIYPHQRMDSFDEILRRAPARLQSIIQNVYPNPDKSEALTYFQHNLPDEQSMPESIWRGQVLGEKGELKSQKEFYFLRQADSPYDRDDVGTAGENNEIRKADEVMNTKMTKITDTKIVFKGIRDIDLRGLPDNPLGQELFDRQLNIIWEEPSWLKMIGHVIDQNKDAHMLNILIGTLIENSYQGELRPESLRIRLASIMNHEGKPVWRIDISQDYVADKDWETIRINARIGQNDLISLLDHEVRRTQQAFHRAGAGFHQFAEFASLGRPVRLEFKKNKFGGMTTTLFVQVDHAMNGIVPETPAEDGAMITRLEILDFVSRGLANKIRKELGVEIHMRKSMDGLYYLYEGPDDRIPRKAFAAVVYDTQRNGLRFWKSRFDGDFLLKEKMLKFIELTISLLKETFPSAFGWRISIEDNGDGYLSLVSPDQSTSLPDNVSISDYLTQAVLHWEAIGLEDQELSGDVKRLINAMVMVMKSTPTDYEEKLLEAAEHLENMDNDLELTRQTIGEFLNFYNNQSEVYYKTAEQLSYLVSGDTIKDRYAPAYNARKEPIIGGASSTIGFGFLPDKVISKLEFMYSDQAMNANSTGPGGIDLNPAQMSMQVKKDGQDFKFNFNGTEIDAAQVTGATFTIRTMTPVTNLPQILGFNLEPTDKPEQVVSLAKA